MTAEGRARVVAEERERISEGIKTQPWKVYGEDYYQTFDGQASMKNLLAIVFPGSNLSLPFSPLAGEVCAWCKYSPVAADRSVCDPCWRKHESALRLR